MKCVYFSTCSCRKTTKHIKKIYGLTRVTEELLYIIAMSFLVLQVVTEFPPQLATSPTPKPEYLPYPSDKSPNLNCTGKNFDKQTKP